MLQELQRKNSNYTILFILSIDSWCSDLGFPHLQEVTFELTDFLSILHSIWLIRVVTYKGWTSKKLRICQKRVQKCPEVYLPHRAVKAS